MKTYRIIIQCTAEKEIDVEAENESEAIEKAEQKFQCEGCDGQWNGESPVDLIKEQ